MTHYLKINSKRISIPLLMILLLSYNSKTYSQTIKSSSGLFQFQINDTYQRLESKHPNNEFTYVNTDTFSMIINVRPNSVNGTVEMYDSINNNDLEKMFKVVFNSPKILKKGKVSVNGGKAAYFHIETIPQSETDHNFFILYYMFYKSKQISITFSIRKERSKKIINSANNFINNFKLLAINN